MNSQKSKGERQRGPFLTRNAELAHRRRNVRVVHAKSPRGWWGSEALRTCGIPPMQIPLAKPGHVVPLTARRLGNVVFLGIQEGEGNQMWAAQASPPQAPKFLPVSVGRGRNGNSLDGLLQVSPPVVSRLCLTWSCNKPAIYLGSSFSGETVAQGPNPHLLRLLYPRWSLYHWAP